MRQVLSHVRRCVEDYQMISPGDNLAVGVSGGKDSLLTLQALAHLRTFYPIPFTLHAITLDLGFPGADFSPVAAFCQSLDVPYTVLSTNIAEILFDIRKESNPCSLCAKMRRGALHEAAIAHSCRKVALGHHYDDAIETFWMSLRYESRLHCFQPVTFLDRRGITLLRPLLYVREQSIKHMATGLPVQHNPCPANGVTKRQEAKDYFALPENQGFDGNVFRAMQNLPLPGWEKDKGQ